MGVCVPESMVGMGVCRATIHPMPVRSSGANVRITVWCFLGAKVPIGSAITVECYACESEVDGFGSLVTGGRRVSILSDSVPETARM